MPRYTIVFQRTVLSSAERTIRARNADKAKERAEAMLNNGQITDWEEEEDDVTITVDEE
jgi:hypothetical protein